MKLRGPVAVAATIAVLGPIGWMWQDSLLPDRYSVTDMGYADYGGGPRQLMSHGPGHAMRHAMVQGPGHAMGRPAGDRPVDSFAVPASRRANVTATLVARRQTFRLASGESVEGYTLNRTSPGPLIRAKVGQLVQVRLVNASVPDGVTLHWHGVDVPNSVDGVAGVTQDAVPVGSEYVYRFVADRPGTYWYHSHQVSHEQVQGGLFGAVVVTPKRYDDRVLDIPAVAHVYGGLRTINGRTGDVRVAAEPGRQVRVRIVNTNNGPMPVWVNGAPYRVRAVDGTDLHQPGPLTDTSVLVTAGGRVDLGIEMPAAGHHAVRVDLGGTSLLLGDAHGPPAPAVRPVRVLDLLRYGTPAPLGFDPAAATRAFRYEVGRRPGFVDGRPGVWWTINGHLFPNVPMFTVVEGDIVRMHISNSSGEVHPMHLHGHHAVVLARNGVPATGSPWWVDSLNVANGESYDIAFVADNPGIWMDHCHNLPHAAQGLVAHLMYEGVTEPYAIGGAHTNSPE